MFKIFIDDSGNKEYRNPYASDYVKNPPDAEKYRDFWLANYFVLCGIQINECDISDINSKINEIKRKYFGTNKVELKSVWMRIPSHRKVQYLEKFNIDEDTLLSFTRELYSLITTETNRIKIIGVVFDKRCYGENLRVTPDGNPLLKSVQILFERILYAKQEHSVVFDQFLAGLKVVRGPHKEILDIRDGKDELTKLHIGKFSNIKNVNFANSAIENFVQLADICAYNIYRQFVDYGRESDKAKQYNYFRILKDNFLVNSKTGKKAGCGLVCIPDSKACEGLID